MNISHHYHVSRYSAAQAICYPAKLCFTKYDYFFFTNKKAKHKTLFELMEKSSLIKITR